jgi:hypothetical protein
MFIKRDNYEKWNFVKDISKTNFIENLINSVNFKENYLLIEEQKKLLK